MDIHEGYQIWRPFEVENDTCNVNREIESGDGSPHISQGVPTKTLKHTTSSPHVSSPTDKVNLCAGNENKTKESVVSSSRRRPLTRSSTKAKYKKENDTDATSFPSATSSSTADKLNSGDGDDKYMSKDDIGQISCDGTVPKKKRRRNLIIPNHITVIGGTPPIYQCDFCKKKFKTKAHINYHDFCQKREKPFRCLMCDEGFITRSHFEYHVRTHTDEKPFPCPKCGREFNQLGKVTRHMRSHTGEKPFICQECNRGFATAKGLKFHTFSHTGEKPFSCKLCNKRYAGMTGLKKHVITHTSERNFKCTECKKRFGLKCTLDTHLKTHSSERPYSCNQCSKAFSDRKDLRRHLSVHTNKRPFKCWLCKKAFKRKDNLCRHIKENHKQVKEVAKKLADEAAAEYLMKTRKAQLLGNIPASKVN